MIAFDFSIAQVNQAGTATYARNLVAGVQRKLGDEFQLLAVDQQRDMSQRKTLRTRLDTLYRDLYWMHVQLPAQARARHADVLHMPANIVPLSSPCPTVVTIHDTTIIDDPSRFTFWHRNYSRVFMPLSARRASRIIAVSEQTKRDIVRCFDVNPQKIDVVYEAASSDFQPVSVDAVNGFRAKYQLEQFILTVGALEPRKNIVRLLQAYAELRMRGVTMPLVHIGPTGWRFDAVHAEIERLSLQPHVRFLGKLPINDLAAAYGAANVFVYPSLYEGFGLPPLEAMSCGCPVVTSNNSSLPEVAGDAGLLINAEDASDIARAIQRILDDDALAHDLRQRGIQRAKQFSWERCADETIAVYRAAQGQN